MSASPGLVHLSCEGCQLATLDLRHCVGLKVLECEYNNLVALNLNEKVQLEVFEGGMQYETYVSPVDGCFDMAAFSVLTWGGLMIGKASTVTAVKSYSIKLSRLMSSPRRSINTRQVSLPDLEVKLNAR